MGVAGRFPPAYMGAMVQGQALGGIIAVSINISMLAVGLDDVDAAFWDFLIAIVYLGTSLVAFLVVTRTEFYQVWPNKHVGITADVPSKLKYNWEQFWLCSLGIQGPQTVQILPEKSNFFEFRSRSGFFHSSCVVSSL